MSAIAGQMVGAIGGQMMDIMAEKRADQRQKRAEDRSEQRERNMAHMYDQYSRDKFEYTGYGAQAQQLRDAGMNIGLMYGSAGQGGQASATTASSNQSIPNVQNNTGKYMEVGLQSAMAEAQLENINAQTKVAETQASKNEAEAENTKGNTLTNDFTRDVLVENLKQSGIAQWLENSKQKYLNEGNWNGDDMQIYKNVVYGSDTAFTKDSWEIQQLNEDILKTMGERDLNLSSKKLTDKKVQYYWNELMNATANANANMIQANATKLAREWETGEYTNWKTWADLADKSIRTVGGLIKGGGTGETTTTKTTEQGGRHTKYETTNTKRK